MIIEQSAERLDHGQHEDREAPEGEGMRDPGDRPLQQLPLTADLADLTPQAHAGSVEPTGSGLTLADQPEQPVEPSSGHRQSDNGDHSTDSESQHILQLLLPTVGAYCYQSVTCPPNQTDPSQTAAYRIAAYQAAAHLPTHTGHAQPLGRPAERSDPASGDLAHSHPN